MVLYALYSRKPSFIGSSFSFASSSESSPGRQTYVDAPTESPHGAGSKSRRETFSLVCHCSPQRHFASCAYSKETVHGAKSKTSQCFIRALFFMPGFDALLHRHLSSDCLHFQPVSTTRKRVDAVLSFHHHAFEIQSLEFFE